MVKFESTLLSGTKIENLVSVSFSDLIIDSNLGFYILIGGICCLFAIIIAGYQIILHLHYFHKPKFQIYIVRILLMVPVRKTRYTSI